MKKKDQFSKEESKSRFVAALRGAREVGPKPMSRLKQDKKELQDELERLHHRK